MKDAHQKVIEKLRTPKYGHGAFGERERYYPSEQDLFLAAMIENLALQLDMRELQVKLLEKQIAEYNEYPDPERNYD